MAIRIIMNKILYGFDKKFRVAYFFKSAVRQIFTAFLGLENREAYYQQLAGRPVQGSPSKSMIVRHAILRLKNAEDDPLQCTIHFCPVSTVVYFFY